MTRTSRFKPLVIAMAAGLAVFACGGNAGGGGNGGSSKGEIDIGVDLPMSGAEASNGVPTLNGVKYAVQKEGTVNGFKIGIVSLDDAVNGKHDPQKGAQNVQQLLSNNKVLAMVGPFNSNVGEAEIPVANRQDLAMISPANTNPCLTKEYQQGGGCNKYAGFTPESLRPTGKNNYFRVAGTDDHQGPANADYAYNTLKIKKVAVLDDAEVYGQGIAATFASRFKQLGGDVVVGPQSYDPNSTTDFRSFLNSAKNAGAEGVYVGGVDANKACVVRSQMAGIFPADAPFLGGDGIVTSQCLNDAAAAAPNMYGTIAAVNADTLSGAKATIDGFKKTFTGATDYGAYTMPAYASTQIILAALGKAIDAAGGKMPTRKQVTDQIAKTNKVSTVLGPVTFDKNGDNSQQVIAEYKSEQATPTGSYAATNDAKSVGWAFVQQKNYTS
ncbi:MAG: branched-chain amino acid ABC transporter substrate-binding protein [Candidatus Dormibacteraeota bacterium]|nr:branched-chain amino acid ABC transporter substrate-binding protein [Candidatus Dormibacteraeota bacterium]